MRPRTRAQARAIARLEAAENDVEHAPSRSRSVAPLPVVLSSDGSVLSKPAGEAAGAPALHHASHGAGGIANAGATALGAAPQPFRVSMRARGAGEVDEQLTSFTARDGYVYPHAVEYSGGGFARIHMATIRDDVDGVQLLLARGGDLDLETSERETCYMLAAKHNAVACVTFFVTAKNARYSLNKRNPKGETPLILAIMHGATEAARVILNAWITWHEPTDVWGRDVAAAFAHAVQRADDRTVAWMVAQDTFKPYLMTVASKLLTMGLDMDPRHDERNACIMTLLLSLGATATEFSLRLLTQRIIETRIDSPRVMERLVSLGTELTDEAPYHLCDDTGAGTMLLHSACARMAEEAERTLHCMVMAAYEQLPTYADCARGASAIAYCLARWARPRTIPVRIRAAPLIGELPPLPPASQVSSTEESMEGEPAAAAAATAAPTVDAMNEVAVSSGSGGEGTSSSSIGGLAVAPEPVEWHTFELLEDIARHAPFVAFAQQLHAHFLHPPAITEAQQEGEEADPELVAEQVTQFQAAVQHAYDAARAAAWTRRGSIVHARLRLRSNEVAQLHVYRSATAAHRRPPAVVVAGVHGAARHSPPDVLPMPVDDDDDDL